MLLIKKRKKDLGPNIFLAPDLMKSSDGTRTFRSCCRNITISFKYV